MISFINILKTLITEEKEKIEFPYLSRKVGDYNYKGYTKNKEISIFNQIGKAFNTRKNNSLESLAQVPGYEKYIDEVYKDLIKNNPELSDIKTSVSGYEDLSFPKHDIVYGALSGIPPKDIKYFVENIRGSGTNIKNLSLFDDTKSYISIKK